MKQNQAKAFLVSGASTGIGKAITLELARQGARVYAGYRSDLDAAALQSIEGRHGGTVIPVRLDVTQMDNVQAVFTVLQNDLKETGLAGLVNNAGIAVMGPLEVLSIEQFQTTLDINFVGAVRLIKTFLPLLKQGKGRIVNMSSTSGFVAWPYASAYVASKFALEGLSDVLRVELKPHDIAVSLVQPGAVRTPIWDKIFSHTDQTVRGLAHRGLTQHESAMRTQQQLIKRSIKGAIAPEKVAATVREALYSAFPKTRYLVGSSARLQKFLQIALAETWFDRLKYRLIMLKTGGQA